MTTAEPTLDSSAHASAAPASFAGRSLGWSLARTWLMAVAPLGLICLAEFLFRNQVDWNDLAFMRTDLPVALVSGVAFALVVLAERPLAHARRLPDLVAARRTAVVVGCAFLALLCWWGTRWYFACSSDEILADFDAIIFSHGRTVAPVAPEWRPFVPALQWQFRIETPGNAFWASLYLPVNAAIRAGLGFLGDRNLAGPVAVVVSILCLFATARRVWPERPDAALLAVGLLATSSQFLVAAITPFAMANHLALNSVWLLLFLRGGAAGHAGAIGVGFLACGLHQVVFHPLFAAPFVLDLWLRRRWRIAATYTAAYAGVCLFWITYWSFALPPGASEFAGGEGFGLAHFVGKVWGLIADWQWRRSIWMAHNLFRFITWQSLLAVPLALLGVGLAVRTGGVLRALAAGFVLTVAVMWIVLPQQGFGWGYRYVHGFLGGLALLAGCGWIQLTERMDAAKRAAAARVMAAGLLVSALVLAPIRFHQAYSWTQPYARAYAAIQRSGAEVAVIDDTSLFEARTLPRNDPFLRNQPKMMLIGFLTPDQIALLCSRYDVALLDLAAGKAAGITAATEPPRATAAKLALMQRLSCGRLVEVEHRR